MGLYTNHRESDSGSSAIHTSNISAMIQRAALLVLADSGAWCGGIRSVVWRDHPAPINVSLKSRHRVTTNHEARLSAISWCSLEFLRAIANSASNLSSSPIYFTMLPLTVG